MTGDIDRPFTFPRRGLLLILSAPSGGGKTTLATRLLAGSEHLRFSISHTTRAPRNDEVHGRDYYFTSEDEFTRMQKADAFAEWAYVHGARYGTSRAPIDAALPNGQDLLLDIDVQGARQIRAHYTEAVSVFVLPPSWSILEARLRRRATSSAAETRQRLAEARVEAGELFDYDYWLINDRVEEAEERLRAILTAERARVARLHPTPTVHALLADPHQGNNGR